MSRQDELGEANCPRCKCSVNTSTKAEVEYLKHRLLDRDITIVQLEAKMAHERPQIYSQGQLAKLRAVCDNWQDKYERLLEAHKRLQRVNQGLEDKLLRLVDRSESEKAKMSEDASNLTTALTTAAKAINRLKSENKRYQSDLSLAIQLLQCNPSQYASHKLDLLPSELQERAKSRMNVEQPKPPKSEARVIRVPIPTFPPTAMVYSVNKCTEKEEQEEEPVDMVSAAIMLAVLEEREKERTLKHCQTCTCGINHKGISGPKHIDSSRKDQSSPPSNGSDEEAFMKISDSDIGFNFINVGTQTVPSYIGETGKVASTCIYCQSIKIVNSDQSPNSLHSSSENSLCDKIKSKNSFSKLSNHDFKDHGSNRDLSNKRHSSSARLSYSWDWHTDSQDSGTPSTPTSLMSASLSYESEASCFTSPQDSPEHLSLQGLELQDDTSSVRLPEVSNLLRTLENKSFLSEENCNVSVKHLLNPYPDQEVFTAPIHSVHTKLKDKETLLSRGHTNVEALPVLFSTTTRSATETSL